jgi:predicted permease
MASIDERPDAGEPRKRGGESKGEWRGPIRAHLAALRLDATREAEIVEELSQHLDERCAELRRAGESEEHARRLALDELLEGNALANAMRSLRQARTSQSRALTMPTTASMFEGLRQDVRHAARLLARAPVFVVAAVLMLGLGVGGTTAIFGVVHGVLLTPLPHQDPDALVRIVHVIGGIRQPYFSDGIFQAYVENTQAFSDVGVWNPESTATITGQGDPEEVRSLTASRSVLTTLAVPPELGRWYSAAEDLPGAPAVVMLAHGYWQRKFAGDPAVLSRSLTIDGRPHQIVGVMPADFRFGGEFEVVRPLRINPAAPVPGFRLLGVARLRDGVTLAQANADVVRVLHSWFETQNTRPDIRARWAPALQSLMEDVVGDVGATLWVLLGAIAIVLAMACANVANLLLVRADGRGREFAIRAALGARWWRIARQLLVETLLLALLGGAVGIALAYGALRALVSLAPANLPRSSEISIDPVVLGFALTISLLSGLLFGSIPILKHARPWLGALGAAGGGTMTRERQRSQQVLVTAQIALALVLLVSAGLMIRSAQALRSVDPGFTSARSLQTFSISIVPTLVREPERVTRVQQDVLEKIAAIPGVSSVAFATRMPMGEDRSSAALTVKGKPDDGRTPPNHQVKVVSPGLFRTQGTPIIGGRDFTWSEVHGTRELAIVSENLARELFGSADIAVGQMIREYYDRGAPWREVIGVVGDVHDDGAHREAPTTVYFPVQPAQRVFGVGGYQARRVTVAIRTERAGTPDLLDQVREAVWSVNPSIPLAEVRTLDEAYRRSMARTSFTLVMLAIAGAMALLLGMCGIYGVISYAVSRRRREIGIRLALGAPPPQVRRLFVRRGVTLGLVGLVVGLVTAFGVTRLMESLLFGVTPLDPMTFVAMPVLLAAAAALASYLPARAALMVDPVETMRAE